MDAGEYLKRIVLHEGKTTHLIENRDLSPVKKRCFGNLLAILCCNSLFEDQPLRADTEGGSFSKEGISYRIERLREKGFDELGIYRALVSSRNEFISRREIKEGYGEIHQRRLHCELYSFVLKDLDRIIYYVDLL
ncbi:MAG: hypothetical protein WC494_02730 [Candidatus Pacearchaeota archaeon]